MTETHPDPRDEATKPISVAELLARNGTIGSPPVTGRRRRRRGNNDAVTVAELTGEIPIITEDTPPPGDSAQPSTAMDRSTEPVDVDPPETSAADRVETIGWAEPEPRWPQSPPQSPAPRLRDQGPERSYYPRPMRGEDLFVAEARSAPAWVAEQMVPDPADDEPGAEADTMTPTEFTLLPDGPETLDTADISKDLPPGFADADAPATGGARSVLGAPRKLFARLGRGRSRGRGRGEATDVVRLELEPELDSELDTADEATGDELEVGQAEPREARGRSSELLGSAATVLQSILAVLFGAGLFVAFDQLWRWNNILALVLTVLVTLGLVAAVQAVRKTVDVASTLFAVAVGLLITLGPLALHTN